MPFLQNTVYPWLAKNIPAAIRVLSDFWTKILYPALEKIWKFITVDLMPVWDALGKLLAGFAAIWNNTLKPALDALWGFISKNILPIFQKWYEALGGIQGIINGVANAITWLGDKLSNLTLPDWLTPGSPTPFEMGLRGISAAMQEINNARLPQFNVGLTRAGGNAAAMSTTNNWNLTINQAGRITDPAMSFRMMQSLART